MWCNCTDSRRYRVTGEVWENPPESDNPRHAGTGDKLVRIRCAECGGKVGRVGSNLLNVLGIPDAEIVNGRCLAKDERVTLEVDLI